MLENYVVQWEKWKTGRKHTVIQTIGGRNPGFKDLVRSRNLSSLSFTVFICKLGISLAFFLKWYIRSKFHSTAPYTLLLNKTCIPLLFPQCWEINHKNIFILVSSTLSSSNINPSMQLWTPFLGKAIKKIPFLAILPSQPVQQFATLWCDK